MAIDMTTVKQIMHGNKEVKKIEDSHGILWQKVEAKVLQSITLSGQTTSLNRKAAFSFGGTVTANYSDGTTANVTSSTTFSGYNMSTAGTYTVTASYTEDSTTVTTTYSLTVNPIWTTLYNNSSGFNMRMWANKQWSTTGVPCNIPTTAKKLRIKYKAVLNNYIINKIKIIWSNGSSYAQTNTYTNGNTGTKTFNYNGTGDILYGQYLYGNTVYMNWSWYRNATWGEVKKSSSSDYVYFAIYKVEEYH